MVATRLPLLSACSCVVLLVLPRPLAYCVRLNSQGAVLPASMAASVSLCRVCLLSAPLISKLRRPRTPSPWMGSDATGPLAAALPCVALLPAPLPEHCVSRQLL